MQYPRVTPRRLQRIPLPQRHRPLLRTQAPVVGREVAKEDSICLNERQNLILVRRYAGICKLRIGDREFEANAYIAGPENTSKGLIKGVTLDETPADVATSLVNHHNPRILHAKRTGNAINVIILFDGYYVPRYVNKSGMVMRCTFYKKHIDMYYERGPVGHSADVCTNPNDKCHGYGCSIPLDDHWCEPVCLLCEKGHLTGDRKCKAKYKPPPPRQATTVGTQNARGGLGRSRGPQPITPITSGASQLRKISKISASWSLLPRALSWMIM
ncbi:hypothetical protein MTO96_041412 [Rhipicephalus appendiculatus]